MRKPAVQKPGLLKLPSKPPKGHKRVYYFTSAQFAVSNVALRRIKVARFSDLNDPFELFSIDRCDWRNRKVLRERTKTIGRTTGLICFSKSWHNPVLWGHYADRHAGICMGFDVPEQELHDVIYTDSVARAIQNPKTGRLTLTTRSIYRLMRTKFKDWDYEDETRLLVQLLPLTSESGKYFRPFSESLKLRELILGPRCDIWIETIGQLVSREVCVSKAKLSENNFRVVWDVSGSLRLSNI